MHKSSEPGQYETRLWQRSGTGSHVIDEFAMYMRLLGWRKRAEYHREASEGEHAFSSTVYVLRLEAEEAATEEEPGSSTVR